LNLFSRAVDPINKGTELFVCSRADLSRTMEIMVALYLSAAITGTVACEVRTADRQNKKHSAVEALHHMGGLVSEQTGAIAIDIKRSNAALLSPLPTRSSHFMHQRRNDLKNRSRGVAQAEDVTIVTDFHRKPFEAAMYAIYASAQHIPAASAMIEHFRKVE